MKFISKELLQNKRPVWEYGEGINLKEHMRTYRQGNQTVAEFISSGQFADEWYERQRYEVDAGRDEEPLLYLPLYSVVESADLPKVVKVRKMGPFGVIFEEVREGGEVKFSTVTESSESLALRHFAVGIEYGQDLVDFNEVWNLSFWERHAGIAHNALLNHLHLGPFVSYNYPAANKTAASSDGTTLAEKYLRTIEDAITHSKADNANPRRGPYDLLINSGQTFMVERALQWHTQDGANPNVSSAISKIRNIIEYDGWTGTRGKKSVTYPGVTSGKALLVSSQYQDEDAQSWVKFLLRDQRGDGDLSRFIVEQVLLDSWLGVYANPLRSTEEITWPTS
jgi:hypothetical protein